MKISVKRMRKLILEYREVKEISDLAFLNLMTTPTLIADCLELALQFGMIMMFACAFPLAFAFAALVNSFAFVVFGLVYQYRFISYLHRMIF